jgi:hypothetical protein
MEDRALSDTPMTDAIMDCIEKSNGADTREQCYALQEAARNGVEALEVAALALYRAGHWTCDRPADEAGLWMALREALHLPPGSSPKPLPARGDSVAEPQQISASDEPSPAAYYPWGIDTPQPGGTAK